MPEKILNEQKSEGTATCLFVIVQKAAFSVLSDRWQCMSAWPRECWLGQDSRLEPPRPLPVAAIMGSIFLSV